MDIIIVYVPDDRIEEAKKEIASALDYAGIVNEVVTGYEQDDDE